MSEEENGFREHRNTILSGIGDLNAGLRELTKELQRSNLATEKALTHHSAKHDEVSAWRLDAEKRLRELELTCSRIAALVSWRDEAEKRLREVEAMRSQALLLASIGSVVFGVIVALIARAVSQ